MRIGLSTIEKHEQKLNALATSLLDKIPAVTIIGPHDSTKRGGIISFSIKGMDSLNVARLLSSQKILVRGGMHCAHAWFNKHKLSGSVRASFYFYNTEEDVHRFVQAVESIARL
jgi:cysteine desulfurase/selenocysteine lyase